MNIEIKKAEIKDISELTRLWKGMINYHQKLSKKDFQLKNNAETLIKNFFIKNIKSKDSIVLKAIINKKTIGYMMAQPKELPPIYKNNIIGYISDGYIERQFRHKGIMNKMIQEAAKFFKKKGLKELGLKAYLKNKKGIGSWSKIGFKKEAVDMYMPIK